MNRFGHIMTLMFMIILLLFIVNVECNNIPGITNKLPPDNLIRITSIKAIDINHSNNSSSSENSDTSNTNSTSASPVSQQQVFKDPNKIKLFQVKSGQMIQLDFQCIDPKRRDIEFGVLVQYHIMALGMLKPNEVLKKSKGEANICAKGKLNDTIVIATPKKVEFGDNFVIEILRQTPLGQVEVLKTGEFTIYNKESELKTVMNLVNVMISPTSQSHIANNGNITVSVVLNRKFPKDMILIVRLINGYSLSSERVWEFDASEVARFTNEDLSLSITKSLLSQRNNEPVEPSDKYRIKLYLKRNEDATNDSLWDAFLDRISWSHNIYTSSFFTIYQANGNSSNNGGDMRIDPSNFTMMVNSNNTGKNDIIYYINGTVLSSASLSDEESKESTAAAWANPSVNISQLNLDLIYFKPNSNASVITNSSVSPEYPQPQPAQNGQERTALQDSWD